MGSSSGGSSSGGGGGGGGGGDNKPAKKKATPKATPVRARNNKQKARKAKTTPKAPKINYGGNGNNNQRANLPSEVSKPVRPATPIKSTAKTTPVATAKITQPKEERPSGTLRDGLATNKIKTVMGIENDGYGVNESGFAGSSGASLLSVKPAVPKSVSTDIPSAYNYMYQDKPAEPVAKALKPVEATNLPVRNYGAFDNDTYQDAAKASKDSIMPTISDKYRNDEVSYNQAYWAARKAGGATSSEIKAEMDSIGMKKAYSGDRVITQDMKSQASDDLSRITGSMATTQNGGVTKTVGETYGLFGERQDTTYDYKNGPSVVTRSNDPSLFGVNFGDKTSTTFVNGVEVATKTGRDPLGRDAKVTRPEGLAKGIKDRVEASPDPVKEISDIDNQIKTETDPAKLKALHKRRLMLMRMNRTNTRFAGMLGEADTKRTNLMSIS